MKAPLCRLCGTAHWSNQPHDLKAAPKPELQKPRKEKTK